MAEDSICLFTTIRAPFADTLAFANYHLNIGIDHIYMFFDDPDDPAADVLGLEKRVTCIRCDSKYWSTLVGNRPESDLPIHLKQDINSRIAIKKSRENGYAWICHIDGDELIYAVGGFKKAIAALPLNVQIARFPVLEAVPEKLSVKSPFQDLCYFKHAPVNRLAKNKNINMDLNQIIFFYMNHIRYQIKIHLAILLGCNLVTKDYIKGHIKGKSVARTNAPIVSYENAHFPIPTGQERLKMYLHPDVKLLHYDAPDYNHWKTKWYIRYMRRQNGVIPARMGFNRRLQFEQFIKVYERGNEEDLVKLYKTNFFISSSDRKILQKVGLVSEIHLPDELFATASDGLEQY